MQSQQLKHGRLLQVVQHFCSASSRLAVSIMTVSSQAKVGFFMYLCLKNTVPDTIGAHVSFTHRFQHRQCSYDVPSTYDFLSVLQMFFNLSVSRGLNFPFRQLQMVTYCCCGVHIGVHKLIFLGLLVIIPTVTFFLCLRDELILQVHWSSFFCYTQHANKMIFTCLYGLLYNVALMVIR